MACGDSYRLTFKTDGGRAWDDPWFFNAGPLDYVRWKSVAERATDRMWEELVRLGKIEEELGRGYTEWNRINGTAAEIFNRRNDLPHGFWATPVDDAPKALQIVKDAACQLEEIDKAIISYGRTPSTSKAGGESKKKGGPMDTIVTYATVALIIGGLWYLDKREGAAEAAE